MDNSWDYNDGASEMRMGNAQGGYRAMASRRCWMAAPGKKPPAKSTNH
jgi:hypothetical protein